MSFDNELVLENPDTGQLWRAFPTQQDFQGPNGPVTDEILYVGPAELVNGEVKALDGPRDSIELEYVKPNGDRLAERKFDFIYDGQGFPTFSLAHDLDTHRSYFGGSGTFTVTDTTGDQLRLKLNDDPYDDVNQEWPDVAMGLHNVVQSWDTSRNSPLIRRLDSHGGYAEFVRLTPKNGANDTHDLWRLCATGPQGKGNPLQCEGRFTCTQGLEVVDGVVTVFKADANGIRLGNSVPDIADEFDLMMWLADLNIINYTGPSA